MALIKLLPAHEIQKIAAGEVVERPASVVKELLENSLDAGANHIVLYIEDGGKKRIRIIDNGCGMVYEDAHACLLPHATSKITSVHELAVVTTFGFRGEALAAIAAVSRMTLITRHVTQLDGNKLVVVAGSVEQESAVAANIGTDITIDDLFYNVPARRKFLKTDTTEWRAIQQLVYAYALDYPACTIELYHNNTTVINCQHAESLEQRIVQLFESPLTKQLINFNGTTDDDMTLAGVMAGYQYSRFDRSQIYIFVNNRWIKNHKLTAAVIKGYQNILPQGQYPFAAVSLAMPTNCVDINVHPRKEEVQFLHPRKVETFIQETIQRHLEQSLQKRVIQEQHRAIMPAVLPFIEDNQKETDIAQNKQFVPISYSNDLSHLIPIPQQQNVQKIEYGASALDVVTTGNKYSDDQQAVVSVAPLYRIIGQLDHTYILLETDEGLVMVDQHAAHERIMYEKIGAQQSAPESIQLLFPEIITLTKSDYEVICENISILASFGFDIEVWGNCQLRINATPLHVKQHMCKDIVATLITELIESQDAQVEAAVFAKKIHHALRALMACKAAIKAHDVLQEHEMLDLIKQLFVVPNRLTCPHGRPTSWLMATYEIEKKFKRII